VHIESVEIYSDTTNAAVMKHPGRHFPGVLVQGDTLSGLCSRADEVCESARQQLDPDTYVELNELRNHLWSFLLHYKAVLGEHEISLPFSDRPPPVTYKP
jgi:hypothetical protein